MKNKNLSIGNSIFVYFSITAVIATIFITIAIYNRLSIEFISSLKKEDENLVKQVSLSVDKYINNAEKLSDYIYSNILSVNDLKNEEEISKNLHLFYDINKDIIDDIKIYSKDFKTIFSVKDDIYKNNNKDYFKIDTAYLGKGIYFSKPYLKNKIEKEEYIWVLSMLRKFSEKDADSIILSIDFKYTSFKSLFENLSFSKGSYIYVVDKDNEILYHKDMQLIKNGLVKENNLELKNYLEGFNSENFLGIKRSIIIKNIEATEWKIVGVREERGLLLKSLKIKLFIIFILFYIIFVLVVINAYISAIITKPIKKLEKSLTELENNNLEADIYIGGSYEIMHLGTSIKNMSLSIKKLMQDIVREHEEKRKIEFDTLQAQINPHFLYNTLDIIVWMIENENKQGAVKVVTALARFFRISLSKGQNIISVKNEIEHVKNYLMIQQMRFKNKFRYEIDLPEELYSYQSLKLILQPIVENAIYHGMEFMDGDGLINIEVKKEDDKLLFIISDNGFGIREENIKNILEAKIDISKRSSGIGIRNVNERIKIYFGKEYGINIESILDVGTKVYIYLPLKKLEE